MDLYYASYDQGVIKMEVNKIVARLLVEHHRGVLISD